MLLGNNRACAHSGRGPNYSNLQGGTAPLVFISTHYNFKCLKKFNRVFRETLHAQSLTCRYSTSAASQSESFSGGVYKPHMLVIVTE